MSPIRPENLNRYPDNWSEIRARIRTRAKNHCEWCGVPNHAIGGRLSDGNFVPVYFVREDRMEAQRAIGERRWCGTNGPEHLLRIIRIVCTVAHLDHQPENNDEDNLRFLCQRCHLHYDARHHAQTREATLRAGKAIGDLFDEDAA